MTVLVRQNIYSAFLDGEATAIDALYSLCSDYEEIESSYKDFERLREQLRDQIGNVLLKFDGPVEIKGFGKLLLTSPNVTISYDRVKIRDLICALVEEGDERMAERIEACQAKSMRSGGLRIERERR